MRLTAEQRAKRRANSRKSRLLRKYGLTLDGYDELLNSQQRACAICNKHEDNERMKLAVDHNHKTGEIRGILCWLCNRRLIGSHTDADLFRKAADYLDRHTGLYVPDKKKKKRKKR